MRLRNELLLFFGGLIAATIFVIVFYAQQTTRTQLMRQIRHELQAPAFLDMLNDELFVLNIFGNLITANPFLDNYRNPFVASNGPMEKLVEESHLPREQVYQKLREAHEGDANKWTAADFEPPPLNESFSPSRPLKNQDEYFYYLWASLQSLSSDTMVGPFLFGREQSGDKHPLDLLILTDRAGEAIAEQRSNLNGSPPEPGDRIPAPLMSAQTEHLIELRLHDQETQSRGGFFVHGDGHLYVGVTLPSNGSVLLLATRMDNKFAAKAAHMTGTGMQVAVTLANPVAKEMAGREGDQVISSVADPSLDSDLVALTRQSDERSFQDAREVKLGGKRYLLTRQMLPDQIGSEVARPVAWIYFLRPLQDIEDYLNQITRGIATTGVFALFVCLVVVPVLSSRVTQPIESLAAKMAQVGKGDLSQEAQPGGSWEVARAAESFNSMVAGLRQKEALAIYVPVEARQEIEQDSSVVLGGQRLRATILFSDLRGFTSLSEKLEPDAVVALLNEYLETMTQVILSHHGSINEYIGDAILAVFYDQEGRCGADQAVRSALAMNEALLELQARTDNPHLQAMKQGIGIHTGDLVRGNIGSVKHGRVKHAVVGDTVNLAARIQDRSRAGKHTCVLISQDSREALNPACQVELFGDEEFKGKAAPVRVWEVVAWPT